MTEEVIVPQDEPKSEPAINETTAKPEQEKPNEGSESNEGSKKPEKKEWYIDTITGLRAGKREAEEKATSLVAQNEALLAALAAAKAGKSEEDPQGNVRTLEPLPENEIERRATEKAIQMAAADKFNNTCNKVHDAGLEEFPDFKEAIANLNAVGAIGQDASFLQTVTELPNAHKLLHHLGNNPDEAMRITKLPPIKMALELAKLESEMNNPKPKALSNAPAPIKPVNGKGKADIDLGDPNLDMKKYSEIRQKQRAERAKGY